MSTQPPRAVFDSVVFIQALISGRGPAAGCVEALKAGHLVLLLSDDLLAEIRDVALRPELVQRFRQLTAERIEAFLQDIGAYAAILGRPPQAMPLPRDPKDEPVLNLAVAGAADYLVTWNSRHLTYLMDGDTREGAEFCRRFPNIRILSAPEFLARIKIQES